jgi:hypothetical protein
MFQQSFVPRVECETIAPRWREMRDNLRTMTDTATLPPLPDRLSIDPSSPFHNRDVFQHDVGIRFNDKDRYDVEEYCLSEGWIKVAAGKTLDRKGKPMLIKLKGKVEAFYK